MANVGLTVQEGVANGVSPFVEASKFNIGLLMERERGLVGVPTLVSSLQEDRLRFGGTTSDMFGAVVTKNLFNNAGSYGASVWGIRIAGSTSATAFGILKDGSKDPLITVSHTSDASSGAGAVDHVVLGTLTQGDVLILYCENDKVQVTVGADTAAETVLAAIKTAIVARIAAAPTGAWAVNYDDSTVVNHTTSPAAPAYLAITGNVNKLYNYYPEYVSTDGIIKFWAGQNGSKDPGKWGNNVTVVCSPKVGVNGKFQANVYYKNNLKESFSATTFTELVSVINSSSSYLYAEPINLNLANLSDDQSVSLIGGIYAAPVESDFYGGTDPIKGLNFLDGIDVQLIANTEHHTLAMCQAIDTYVNNRDKCMNISCLPYLANDAMAITFATALQKDTPSNTAAYNFWVKTTDDSGNAVWAPGIGCILGAGYIRTPMMSRGLVWIPPAGIDAVFSDISDATPTFSDQAKINLYVQKYTINVLVFRKGKGFFPYSSRTFSTNALYNSIHVRRMTLWLKETLYDNTLFAVQKPLNNALRRELVVSVTMFMYGLYDDGGLENSVPKETAVNVVCDKSNNPPTQDRKSLNVDINWIPVECTEALTLRLNRNDGVLIVSQL